MPGLYLDTGYLPERVTVLILGQGLGHPPELCQSYWRPSSESAYPMAEDTARFQGPDQIGL